MGRLIPAGTGVASLQPHGSGDGRADGARDAGRQRRGDGRGGRVTEPMTNIDWEDAGEASV